MNEIAEEEKHHRPPEILQLQVKEEKEHVLYENFVQVNRDVEQMCNEIMQFVKK